MNEIAADTFITKLAISNGKDSWNLCFGECTTYVELQDEGGGLFLEIIQEPNDFNANAKQTVRIDFSDIDALYSAMKILKTEADKWIKLNRKTNDVLR